MGWRPSREDVVGLILAGSAAALTYAYLRRRESSLKTTGRPFLVDSNKKYSVKLVAREHLGRNVVRLRFALPDDCYLGLETGQHIQLTAEIGEKSVTRNYTPVSLVRELGYFELIIKVYDEVAEQPGRGAFSRHIGNLPIGGEVLVRGPVGQNVYHGRGTWTVKKKTQKLSLKGIKKLGLVAGGSGITPMLQTLHHVANDLDDPTEIGLVFANSSDDDLFLQEYLDALREASNSRLQVWYTLSTSKKSGADWPYSVGRIDHPMLSQRLPSPGSETLILICGPRPFETTALEILARVGHHENNIITL
ncbi:unnamed protein product, partial [Mesorhabditis spiculigera]